MTRLSCTALFIAMNILLCVLAEEELYPDTYDNTDVKAVLENIEMREEYYKCFMGTGPCKTEVQKLIKGISTIYYRILFSFLNDIEISIVSSFLKNNLRYRRKKFRRQNK